MSIRYEIDGYEVVFVPWHSEYLDEDFAAVCVLRDGKEVMHAGMAHVEPTEQSAREGVGFVKALRGDAE